MSPLATHRNSSWATTNIYCLVGGKINEIGKLVGEGSENALIGLGDTSITVNVSSTTFISKLIEGRFPDYEQVIPSGDSTKLTINRKIFSESQTH